ncbi:MAG: asparagine synthetase B [Methanobrevibacter sp.]|jgi:asparagine synthase (glutamine-hydrolysing)|nr:asparagine synthetase B [Candidatus Methanovirga aequatorialis]
MAEHEYFLDHYLKYGLELSFHGEIYNHKEINDFLSGYSSSNNLDYLYNAELFLYLIHFLLNSNLDDFDDIVGYLKENQSYQFVFSGDGTIKSEFNFLIATLYGSRMVNGDFVFSISDGENMAISRDVVGSYLLYYGHDNKPSFANSRRTLLSNGILDVKTFKPGYVMFNGELYPPLNPPWNKAANPENGLDLDLYIESKNLLIKLLKRSVNMRVNDLDEVGLFFSGGVDSTTIAKILRDVDGLDVRLFTVGTKNSKDLGVSKKIAKDLGLDLEFRVVNEEILRSEFEDFLLIGESKNTVDLGVGMTMYLTSQLAVDGGFETILTGQGADELFGGYNRYLDVYAQDKNSLTDEFRGDIEFMYEVNLRRDLAIANFHDLNFRSPFLDKDFVRFALSLPVDYKVKSSDDKLRKHILRDVAVDLGVPSYIAYRQKKAAQYGSGIHKIITKKVLPAYQGFSRL